MVRGTGRKIEVQTPDDDAGKPEAGKASGSQAEPEVVEPEVLEPEVDDPDTDEAGTMTPDDGERTCGKPESDEGGKSEEKPDAGDASEKKTAEPVDAQAIADEVDEVIGNVKTDSEQVAEAKRQAAEANDRYLRLQAEWDNYRKRTAGERETERQRATEHLVKELLPVVDDFERAIEHAKTDPDVKTLATGVEAVHTKLLNVLEHEHVEVIDPLDEAFDANRHQAVGTTEDAEKYDETVTQVYQRGYEMAGHVIRPAMVIVSTGGPKRPSDTDDGKDGE